MKTIILLTDFSENAEHAAACALMLTVKTNAELILFHAYPDILSMPYYTSVPRYGEDPDRWRRQSERDLESLRSRLETRCLEQGQNIPVISLHLFEGDLGSGLVAIQKQKSINFVVMGPRTDCAISRFFNGSETRDVIDGTICPVWIVPPKAPLRDIHKLILATDFDAHELKALHALIRVCKIFQAQLEVVHVTLNGDNDAGRERTFLKQLNKIKSPLISYKEIRGRQLVNRLNRICRQTGADALAVLHHRQTFLNRLFHHSTINEALTNQKVPLLVLPIET